jgi:hypothetical protein
MIDAFPVSVVRQSAAKCFNPISTDFGQRASDAVARAGV